MIALLTQRGIYAFVACAISLFLIAQSPVPENARTGAATAANSYANDIAHFNYDSTSPLDIKELSLEHRGDATIHNITYASPKGGVVPAYLVVPDGGGKFAAILWGHWLMPHSPTANRAEFLDEALALAPTGAISLLIDAPQVRPGFKPATTPLSAQDSELDAQQVIDLRRGLDLLLARDDVDPKRVAYVGHSYDGDCGAMLDAADKRLTAVVLMGNPQSERDRVLTSNYPGLVALRNRVPHDKLVAYLDEYEWSDAATYASHLGPAAALFQYATNDEFVAVDAAKKYFQMASGPKELKFYDSTHALNAAARRDRVEFLRAHLALTAMPEDVSSKIPETK